MADPFRSAFSLLLPVGLSGGASSHQPSRCQSSCVTRWSSESGLRRTAISVHHSITLLLCRTLFTWAHQCFVFAFFFFLNCAFILNISADRQTDRRCPAHNLLEFLQYERDWSSALLVCVGRNEAARCRHVNSSVLSVGRGKVHCQWGGFRTIPAFIGRGKFRDRKWTEA